MIIFGKNEREKLEEIRDTLSDAVCRRYDEAKTYRDGKWVMFEPTDTSEFDDYMKLLAVKIWNDLKKFISRELLMWLKSGSTQKQV